MRRLAMATMIVLGGAVSASAQDAGKFGVTMGYPASIGVIWHVSNRIALRPEISLQQIATTTTSTISITTAGSGGVTSTSTTTTATNDQWFVGYGASALFYIKQWDALRAYVSPRFQYTHGSSSSSTTLNTSLPISTVPASTEFTQNSYLYSGSFGAQYGLGSRFGLYGEVGFGYTHQTSESSFAAAGDSTGHTVATRSGVGVIFYFGS